MSLNTCKVWVSSEYGLKIECLPSDLLFLPMLERGLRMPWLKGLPRDNSNLRLMQTEHFACMLSARCIVFQGKSFTACVLEQGPTVPWCYLDVEKLPWSFPCLSTASLITLICIFQYGRALLNIIDEQDTADNLLIPTIFKIHGRRFSLCVNLLSLSSVSLNLAPPPSSFEQHVGNYPPLSSCVTDLHWSFAYTLFMTGKESCRMDLGDDLGWGLLPVTSFLPVFGPRLLLLTPLRGLPSCGSLCKAEPHSSVLLSLALSLVISGCLPKNRVLSETDCQRAPEFASTRTLTMRATKQLHVFLLGNLVFSFVLQKWENPLILKQMYANTFINIGNRKISYCFLYK